MKKIQSIGQKFENFKKYHIEDRIIDKTIIFSITREYEMKKWLDDNKNTAHLIKIKWTVFFMSNFVIGLGNATSENIRCGVIADFDESNFIREISQLVAK